MLFSYLIILLVSYFVLRFVFGFIIPLVAAGLNVKRKVKEMKDQMNGYNGTQQAESKSHTQSAKSTKVPTSDYIDFEEIK